ncbi:MAG: HDIG domain-containing protein [Bacillota bacterium]
MRRAAWGVLFLLLLAALFISSALPQDVDVRVGEPAPFNIKAPKDFVDGPATEQLRRQAMEEVPDVYEQDPAVLTQVLEDLGEIFAQLRGIREGLRGLREEDPEADEIAEERLMEASAAVQEVTPLSLAEEEVEVILEARDEDIDRAEELAADTLESMLAQGVKTQSMDAFRDQIMSVMIASDLPPILREVTGKLSGELLQPNLLYQAEETAQRRQLAADSVRPVTIVRGEIVVPDGKVVTVEDLLRLRDAGLLEDDSRWRVYISAFAYALLLHVLVASYLVRFNSQIFYSESRIVLAGLAFIVTLFACRFALELSPFIMPVATGAMLLAILLDANTAVVLGLAMGLSTAVITGGNVGAVVINLVGATTASLAVSTIEERTDIMRAGLWVSLANVVVLVSFLQYEGGLGVTDPELLKSALWAGGNGILSAVAAIGLLPFLESFFGILTPVKLLELANPNHPLLRELLEEAPGTYHHSMMVANLAESATEAVGGDSLLARVGAYYHDVGKARRPYFFVENQFGGENPHDKLSPNLSALIIVSHVRDGLEMAREAGLPDALLEFIAEHHGTLLIRYFYSRAQNMSEDEEVPEDNYRYPGPRPQSKATAVVMLADAVEAAARSLSRPTPDRIKAVVRNIIHQRLEEGQLDKCDLTFRDLDRVADSFTRVLSGAFHHRLEYPENVVAQMKKEQEGEEDGDRGDDGAGGG